MTDREPMDPPELTEEENDNARKLLYRNEELVEVLRQLLHHAEEANIVDIAYAVQQPGGANMSGWSSSKHLPGLIGAVASLQFRLCRAHNDSMTVTPTVPTAQVN